MQTQPQPQILRASSLRFTGIDAEHLRGMQSPQLASEIFTALPLHHILHRQRIPERPREIKVPRSSIHRQQ
ncbi:MAG: hypothetical protein ACK559_18285, partial [bacterium]